MWMKTKMQGKKKKKKKKKEQQQQQQKKKKWQQLWPRHQLHQSSKACSVHPQADWSSLLRVGRAYTADTRVADLAAMA